MAEAQFSAGDYMAEVGAGGPTWLCSIPIKTETLPQRELVYLWCQQVLHHKFKNKHQILHHSPLQIFSIPHIITNSPKPTCVKNDQIKLIYKNTIVNKLYHIKERIIFLFVICYKCLDVTKRPLLMTFSYLFVDKSVLKMNLYMLWRVHGNDSFLDMYIIMSFP